MLARYTMHRGKPPEVMVEFRFFSRLHPRYRSFGGSPIERKEGTWYASATDIVREAL